MRSEDVSVIGLLVITHGRLAIELVEAARTIVGDAPGVVALCLDWNDDADGALQHIESAVRQADRGEGVLVLTDMFGGTPTNLALSLLGAGSVEIVTGVNLPMVIKFINLRGSQSLDQVARSIAEQGREAIHVASQLLGPQPGAERAES